MLFFVASVFFLMTRSEENVDEDYQVAQNQAYLSPISGIDFGTDFNPPIPRRLAKKKKNKNKGPKSSESKSSSSNGEKCKKPKKKPECGRKCFSFKHGIASGDATSTSIILWTRITQIAKNRKNCKCRHCIPTVRLKVKTTGRKTKRFVATTSRKFDYTVKIDVKNLSPNTAYTYQFQVGRAKSVVGRMKTLPEPNAAANTVSIQFAQVTCQSFTSGYFLVYRDIAADDSIDFVVHHGDTIYEGTSTSVFGPNDWPNRPFSRNHLPERELYTLEDYRTRHAQYKTDENYQAALAAKPFYLLWDDHEVVNDFRTDGADTNNASILPFSERKRNGIRAFYEWHPIRRVSASDFFKAFRAYSIGKLMELTILDSRAFNRTQQKSSFAEASAAPFTEHHMIGAEQREFLFNQVNESVTRGTVWHAISNAVSWNTGHPLQITPQFFPLAGKDSWLGYYQERRFILNKLKELRQGKNLMFLAGDAHTFLVSRLVNEIDYVTWAIQTNNGQTPVDNIGETVAGDLVGIEIMTPSVTSPGAETLGEALLQGFEGLTTLEWRYLNPLFDFRRRGYVVNKVSETHWSMVQYGYNNVTDENDPVQVLASSCWEAGSYDLVDPLLC